jgi:hypothetical protein
MCILAEMLADKLIMPEQTEIEQPPKIFKPDSSRAEDHWAKAKLLDVTLFKSSWPYQR